MKIKVLAVLAAFCCGAFGGHLQAQDDGEGAIWGIKANVNMEIPGNWRVNGSSLKMYDNGVGFNVGAVCNLYLGHNFYFEPGAMLFYESYKYNDLNIIDETGTIIETSPSIYKVGVRMPLVFGYTIGITDSFNLSVYTGPQVSYAFAGEAKVKHPDAWGDDFPSDLFGIHGQRRFDLSWKIGVGMPLGSQFVLNLEGDIGITDLLKSDTSFRENRVGLGLTYYF